MDRGSAGWMTLYVIGSSLLYFFVKEGLTYASPLAYTALRFALSAIVTLSLSRRLALDRDVAALVALAASSSVIWAWGLSLVEPATSASMSYFMPFIAMGLGYLVLGEGLGRRGAAGAALGAVGVSLYAVASLRSRGSALGVTLTLANTVLWAGYTVMYRVIAVRRGRNADMASVNLTMFALGTAMLLPFLALDPVPPKLNVKLAESLAWASTLGGALQFFSWSKVLERMRVSTATLLSYTVPAVTAGVQAAMGEPIGLLQAAGLGVMVLGAFIAMS